MKFFFLRRGEKSRNGIKVTAATVIFLTALAVRITVVFLLERPGPPQLWEFGPIAKNLVQGFGYSFTHEHDGVQVTLPSAYMPPGYSMFLAFILSLFGEHPSVYSLALFVQALVGALSAVLIFKISLKLFQERAATVSGFLCALYPPLVYSVLDFGPTVLYLTTLGTIWYLGLSSTTHRNWLQVTLAGFCAALLSLLRAEGVLVAIGFSLWYLLRGSYRKTVIFLSALIIGISPWLLRNYLTFDEFVPMTTSFGFNLWRGNNPSASGSGRDESGRGIWSSAEIEDRLSTLPINSKYEVKRDRVFFQEAFAFMRQNPKKELLLILKKIILLWTIDVTHPRARSIPYVASWLGLFGLFLIGLTHGVPLRPGVQVLLLFYLTMTIVAAMFFVLPRYQIILSYGLVPLSGSGAQQMLSWFHGHEPKTENDRTRQSEIT